MLVFMCAHMCVLGALCELSVSKGNGKKGGKGVLPLVHCVAAVKPMTLSGPQFFSAYSG